MATLLHLPNLREGYIELIDHVIHHGESTTPRGLPVIELTDVTFTVANLRDTIPLGIGRELSTVVAALEALQLQGGISVPDLLLAIAPQFSHYTESDGSFWGAYGERVGDQVDHVIEKLRLDAQTRQAVITLWDSYLDNNYPKKRDYPCTIALGFQKRDDQLNLSVTMRSNDVWLGVAYDVFVFTQLQWSLALALGVEPGTYTHTAWNMHVYERDLPRVAKLHPPRTNVSADHPTGLRDVRETDWQDLARELLVDPVGRRPDLTLDTSARWYLERTLQAHHARERA